MRFKFDQYCLDLDRRELTRTGVRVEIEPQVFQLLAYLIPNRDRVVPWAELIDSVWRGRFISDSTLSSRISVLRKAVGDSGKEQRLIRTISGSGLRFVGEVQEDQDSRTNPGGDAALKWLLGSSPALPDQPSIAVLPFSNLSGDPEQEYVCDGFTEDIITALSHVRWFFVIARNSTFTYKARAVDVREVARQLGVRYVLEGSLRATGTRLRIVAQLVEAHAGRHIWAETYDRDLADLLALQNEIAASIAAAIEPQLVEAEALRSESRRFPDLDAWDLLARAISRFWRLTASDNAEANEILRKAVERHETYAPPHSLLAFSLLVAGHMGWTSPDKAEVHGLASRAAALDPYDPWAHMALGYIAFSARETDNAVAHFQEAIGLNPNFAPAYGYAGWTQAHDGRCNEAIENLQRAIRMSPRDPFNVFYCAGFAAAHYVAGRYSEAAAWARQALFMRPDHLGARRKLCASLAQSGDVTEANQELRKLLKLQPQLSATWIEQSVPYTKEPMAHFLEGMRKAGLKD